MEIHYNLNDIWVNDGFSLIRRNNFPKILAMLSFNSLFELPTPKKKKKIHYWNLIKQFDVFLWRWCNTNWLFQYLLVSWSELARDALKSEGYCVIGGYMSPVNDAYKKRVCNLLEHIINRCKWNKSAWLS